MTTTDDDYLLQLSLEMFKKTARYKLFMSELTNLQKHSGSTAVLVKNKTTQKSLNMGSSYNPSRREMSNKDVEERRTLVERTSPSLIRTESNPRISTRDSTKIDNVVVSVPLQSNNSMISDTNRSNQKFTVINFDDIPLPPPVDTKTFAVAQLASDSDQIKVIQRFALRWRLSKKIKSARGSMLKSKIADIAHEYRVSSKMPEVDAHFTRALLKSFEDYCLEYAKFLSDSQPFMKNFNRRVRERPKTDRIQKKPKYDPRLLLVKSKQQDKIAQITDGKKEHKSPTPNDETEGTFIRQKSPQVSDRVLALEKGSPGYSPVKENAEDHISAQIVDDQKSNSVEPDIESIDAMMAEVERELKQMDYYHRNYSSGHEEDSVSSNRSIGGKYHTQKRRLEQDTNNSFINKRSTNTSNSGSSSYRMTREKPVLGVGDMWKPASGTIPIQHTQPNNLNSRSRTTEPLGFARSISKGRKDIEYGDNIQLNLNQGMRSANHTQIIRNDYHSSDHLQSKRIESTPQQALQYNYPSREHKLAELLDTDLKMFRQITQTCFQPNPSSIIPQLSYNEVMRRFFK